MLTFCTQSITILVGIVIIFVLPDFPHTWKLLSPEMKFVANRRMASDGSEADVDEAGGMSQLRGAKLAFMDIKVHIPGFTRCDFHADPAFADLHHCFHVPLHHRCDWIPEFLPITHSDS